MQRNQWFQDFLLSGNGKWRPFSTPLLLAFGRWFGFDLQPFQVTSMIAYLLATIIFSFLVLRLTNSLLITACGTLIFISSPFTWLIQSWVYGPMEAIALLTFAISLASLSKFIFAEAPKRRYLTNSFVMLAIATFTHERYIILAFAFWFYLLAARSIPKFARRYSSYFLFIPIAHIFLKSFAFGLSPISSGGESGGHVVDPVTLMTHLAWGIQGVFGGLSGGGRYFSNDTFSKAVNQEGFGLQITGTICLIILSYFFAALLAKKFAKGRLTIEIEHKEIQKSKSFTIFLVTLSGTLLIPGALVPERFEGRWILASQILLFAAVLIAISKTPLAPLIKYFTVALILGPVLCANIGYRRHVDHYFAYRQQVNEVMEQLDEAVPRTGPWSVVIIDDSISNPVQWQFSYGYVFQQLENPPYRFLFSREKKCPSLLRKVPCYSVDIDAPDNAPKVARISDSNESLDIGPLATSE